MPTRGGQITVLRGHQGQLSSAAFSYDGKRIVTASDDRTVRIWDVATGNEIKALSGHYFSAASAAFSPDGTRIVTASRDPFGEHTARVWDATTGKEIKSLYGHVKALTSAAFSPDGARIVTASFDRTARIFDAESGKQITRVRHLGPVNSAAFSPDGTRIVTTSDDGTARIWNAESGKEERSLDSKQMEVLPFSKQLFAISSVSGGSLGAMIAYAALFDSQTGAPPCKDNVEETDWFAPYVKDSRSREHWRAHDSWRGCLQLLVAGDFLSPVMLSLATTDLFGFGASVRGDRAVALERAWEKRYASITGHSTLEEPLIAIHQRAAKSGRWLPIMLLNGTSVTTGRRIVTSHLAMSQAGDNLFSDAYDFYELLGRKEDDPSLDVRLSTAITMTSRFPIISPHGNIRHGGKHKIVDRVVDGGYFEIFGALTATELAQELKKRWLTPVIIVINNEPTNPRQDCSSGFVAPPEAAQRTWFGTLGSPLQTVLATRDARGSHAAAALCREVYNSNFAFVSVERDPYSPNKDLSMNWWLSKYVQKRLDDQLNPDSINDRAFEKIATARKLLRQIEPTDVKVSSH